MKLNDIGKLLLLLYIVTMAAVLAIVNVVDADFVKIVLGTVLGYATGNGVLAKRGETSSPVIAAKNPKPDL